MGLKTRIVSFRIIRAAVGAATFLTCESGLQDDAADLQQVFIFDREAVNGSWSLLGEAVQPAQSILEFFLISNNASAIPHDVLNRAADLVKPRVGFRSCVDHEIVNRSVWLRFRPHGHCCASPEHETFQQRIARQAIGAVNAGGGRFSGCEKSRNRRASVEVGPDATHQVVSGRLNRHRYLGDIDPVTQAGFVDSWKTLSRPLGIEMS